MKKLTLSIISTLCLSMFAISSCDKGGSGGGGADKDDKDGKDSKEKSDSTAAAPRNLGIEGTNLIPVVAGDSNWVFLTPDGNVINTTGLGQNPHISLPYNGYFVTEESDGYSVYKLTGNDGKYEPVPNLKSLKYAGYFNDGLIPATLPNGKIGVYDGAGNRKFELSEAEGQPIDWVAPGYSDELLMVRTQSGKYGWVDTSGKVAIKAVYDMATNFNEGYAAVTQSDVPEGDGVAIIIDKKGNTVFRLKPGENIQTNQLGQGINHGYVVANTDHNGVLYNMKGESVTFPSIAYRLNETNGQYVIFMDRNYKTGVADMAGNVIIEPKYNSLFFNDGFILYQQPADATGFLAMESDNTQTVLLNPKGEVQKAFPYATMLPLGKFGYIGVNNDQGVLLDKDGNRKGGAVLKNINLQIWGSSSVHSDFKDYTAMANSLAGLVNDFSVGGYALGASPSDVLPNADPENYTGIEDIDLPNLGKSEAQYSTSATGHFSSYIALSDWNDYNYSYYYYWNYDSKLTAIDISFSTNNEWGKEGNDALVKAFQNKGYSIVKQGYSEGNPAAVLSKDHITVYVEGKEYGGYLFVTDTSLPDSRTYYTNMLGFIDSTTPPRGYDTTAQVDSIASVSPVMLFDTRAEAPTDSAYYYRYDYDFN